MKQWLITFSAVLAALLAFSALAAGYLNQKERRRAEEAARQRALAEERHEEARKAEMAVVNAERQVLEERLALRLKEREEAMAEYTRLEKLFKETPSKAFELKARYRSEMQRAASIYETLNAHKEELEGRIGRLRR